MNEHNSARERPDQTYPAESGRMHPSAPPTEDPALKRANSPETAETSANDLQHRPEDRPDMAHRTGGRDIDPSASLRQEVEAPLADGNQPIAAGGLEGEQRGPSTGLPYDATQAFGSRDGDQAARDPSVRNESQLAADSQAEFPAEDRAFEWRAGTSMPKERTGDLYYSPQQAPPDKKPRRRRRAFAVTAMAAGIGLIALTRMRKRR